MQSITPLYGLQAILFTQTVAPTSAVKSPNKNKTAQNKTQKVFNLTSFKQLVSVGKIEIGITKLKQGKLILKHVDEFLELCKILAAHKIIPIDLYESHLKFDLCQKAATQSNFKKALELAPSIKDPVIKQKAYLATITGLADQDETDQALEYIDKLSNTSFRDECLYMIIESLCRQNKTLKAISISKRIEHGHYSLAAIHHIQNSTPQKITRHLSTSTSDRTNGLIVFLTMEDITFKQTLRKCNVHCKMGGAQDVINVAQTVGRKLHRETLIDLARRYM